MAKVELRSPSQNQNLTSANLLSFQYIYAAELWSKNLPDRVKTGLGGNAGEPSRQTCPHEILAGQAGDFAEIVGATSWLSVITPVDLQKPARRRLSGRNRGHRLFKPNNIQHPPEIVGERGQAELGRTFSRPRSRNALWFINCLIVPNGCSTVSRRRSRISGRFAKRACIRSNTASFSRRETVRNLPPVHCERILQSSHASLLT